MSVTVNGARRETGAANLLELWREEVGAGEADPRRGFAMARNGELVPHAAWETTPLQPDDRIEIVRAMQGG